jgi:hypothetical protein
VMLAIMLAMFWVIILPIMWSGPEVPVPQAAIP